MPVYEYECKKCGKKTEVLHGLDEQGPRYCPNCHGELKRLIGAPALIFKGSGFYVTDYARKDKQPVSEEPKKPTKGRDEATEAPKNARESAEQGSKTNSEAKVTEP